MTDEKYYRIGRLFSMYLDASVRFREIYDEFEQGTLSYSTIEDDTHQPRASYQDGGFFFKLKEFAHSARKVETLDGLEGSLCWIIETACSDIFHNLTIVRESLYQSHRNDIEKNKLEACLIRDNKSYGNEDIRKSLDTILESDAHTKNKIPDILEDIKKVKEIPKDMFRHLLYLEKDNHFIMYAIYTGLDKIKELYGNEYADSLIDNLYSCDETGFKIKMRNSFLSKGYFDEAEKLDNELFKKTNNKK